MRTTRLVTGLGGLVVMAMLALVPARAQTGKAEIQWLGQAAAKITTPGGKVSVIDPWPTTNPKTPAQYNVPMRAPAGLQNSLVTRGIPPTKLAPRTNKV